MMSRTKRNSPGWASFDVKYRQKQGVESVVDTSEPYPPIPRLVTAPCLGRDNDHPIRSFSSDHPIRSFSSVVVPSTNFPTLTEKKDYTKAPPAPHVENITRKRGDNVMEDHCGNLAFTKLKELHSWAENSLIEDILVGVNNDIDKASVLLKAMSSTGSFDINNQDSVNIELGNTTKDPLSEPLVNIFHHAEGSSASEDYLTNHIKEVRLDSPFSENQYQRDASDMQWILRQLNSLPIEPEYEEDDIYLSHRKEALKATRSASQHSRAATSAFSRGDHISAQQHSVKARGEWLTAERLNATAANEILKIRNINNDIWKLDLHGLHAAEAIQALKEHLWKIETQISLKPSVSLQVITGKGIHSRGEAALPVAIRNFLNENGYRFNDTRPGMVTVIPKFRHR